MAGINVGRWFAGGIAAGILIWLVEGAASMLYTSDMQAAMQAHGLSMDMGPPMIVMSIAISLIVGLALAFFYAAARPRFGPGPKTAVIVAVALWLGGHFPSLVGYEMMELFPTRMLAQWSVVGLVEMILAAILGGWIYREA